MRREGPRRDECPVMRGCTGICFREEKVFAGLHGGSPTTNEDLVSEPMLDFETVAQFWRDDECYRYLQSRD
jgi:hypothetical protein